MLNGLQWPEIIESTYSILHDYNIKKLHMKLKAKVSSTVASKLIKVINESDKMIQNRVNINHANCLEYLNHNTVRHRLSLTPKHF